MNRYTAIHLIHLELLIFIHQIHNGGGFSYFEYIIQNNKLGKWIVCNDVAYCELVQWVQHNVVKVCWNIFFHTRREFVHGRIDCAGCGNLNNFFGLTLTLTGASVFALCFSANICNFTL